MNNRLAKPGVLLALCALLAACGAERDEPFNASSSSDDDSDQIRDALTVTLVNEDSTRVRSEVVPNTEFDSRRIEVIREETDFESLIDNYTDTDETVATPSFSQGQVVMIDSGWYDDSSCAQQLELDRVEAFSITEDESVGEVVLTYQRQAADDDAECSTESPRRVWSFHYIETRADLIVVEEVDNLDEDSGSSASSSSESSSSSSSAL